MRKLRKICIWIGAYPTDAASCTSPDHLFPRDPTPGSESRNAPQIRTSLNYKVGDVEADAAAPLRALKLFQPEREKAERGLLHCSHSKLPRLASRWRSKAADAGLIEIRPRFRQFRVSVRHTRNSCRLLITLLFLNFVPFSLPHFRTKVSFVDGGY